MIVCKGLSVTLALWVIGQWLVGDVFCNDHAELARPQVHGGQHINISEARYVVFIATPQCTGSLLSSQWVLSAAHCFVTLNKPRDVQILAGIEHLKDRSIAQIRRAKVLVMHPNHSSEGLPKFDFALIKVTRKFDLSSRNVGLLPLGIDPWPQEPRKRLCMVIGWGSAEEDASTVADTELRALDIYADHGELACGCLPESEKRTSICLVRAGGEREGICAGDSGGPLVCDGSCYGIASYGYRTTCVPSPVDNPWVCPPANDINVYMFVCPVLDWIRLYVKTTPAQPVSCVTEPVQKLRSCAEEAHIFTEPPLFVGFTVSTLFIHFRI